MSKAWIRDLERIVGADGVVTRPSARAAYECDAYTLERELPELVVLPRTVEEARRVVVRIRDAGRSRAVLANVGRNAGWRTGKRLVRAAARPVATPIAAAGSQE